MKAERFDEIVESQIEHIKQVLIEKNKGYSPGEDKLTNFKMAGQIDNVTPTRALHGMLLKHYTSYKAMLDNIDKGKIPSIETLNEKIGDIINYMILFKMLVIEIHDENSLDETNHLLSTEANRKRLEEDIMSRTKDTAWTTNEV